MNMRKRIISLFMALVLVCSCCFAATTAHADVITGNQQVTLTGTYVDASTVSGDNWVIYLNTNGYTSTDWRYKYQGFTYECNGVVGTTTQVSSADGNRLYCTIPTSALSTSDGTVLKIKAGQYDPDIAGETIGLNITNDIEVAVIGNHLVWPVLDVATVEPFNHSASSFYFNLKDANGTPISTGHENWNNFLSPSWYNSTRVDTADWNTVYSAVLIDGAPMDYWGAHFKNVDAGTFYVDGLSATQGTTVTIKGFFTSSTQANWTVVGSFFLKEMTFTYNGSTWEVSRPITYNDVTLTSVWAEESKVNGDNWVIYFNTSSYTSTDWSKKYKGFTYEINGVTGTTSQVSSAEENRLYCTIPTSALSTDEGTLLKIKAGQYGSDNAGATIGLNITNDIELAVIGGHLITPVFGAATIETFNHSASSFYFHMKDADDNKVTTGVENWTNFLSPSWYNSTRVDSGDWATVYSSVLIDGNLMDYWGAHFKSTPDGFYIDGLSAVAGTTVTIKGFFTSSTQADWTVEGSIFLKEMSFKYDGSTWSYVESADTPTYTEHTGVPTYWQGNGTSGFYFSAGETAFPNDAENWSVVANAGAEDGSGVFLNGNKTSVYLKKVNEDLWYVCLSDASVVPAAGDVVTVKGAFIHENHRITFVETMFSWDGTTWAQKEDEQTVSLDFVDLLTISDYNATSGKWEVYLSTTNPLPGVEEETTFDVLMNIGGQDYTVTCKKSSMEQAFAFEIDGSVIPENPAEEVVLTIKAGTYDVSGQGAKIKITSNMVLYFANGFVDTISSNLDMDEENITFTLDRTMEAGGTVKGIYLTANDNVPYDVNWATNTVAHESKTSGVFLNGVKTNVFLKKYGSNQYYVCLQDVNVVPKEGDIVTVKGIFKTDDYISSYNEYSVTYKDGSWVDGTEIETVYTKVTISEYDNKVSQYNKALNRWELYFATEELLPGNVDQPFNTVLVNINGTEYYMPCYHAGYRDAFLLIIESDKLPQITNDDEIKVVVSGKAKSEDLTIGVDVQEFTLYANKYGMSIEGFIEPIKVSEENVKLTLDDKTFGWMAGSEAGIYLFTPDNVPIDETWQTPIRAVAYDANSGIFYNGTKIDAVLKKHADGMIYLDVAAGGVFAKDKDAITIKGVFTVDGYGVSYAEQTFYFNGQSWGTTYKEPVEQTFTKLNPVQVTSTSSYNPERKAWDIYVQVDDEIPGGHDYEYKNMTYEVNGKSYETNVYRVNDTLVFFVPETVLPKDAADGTAITLKAGKASDNYDIYGIELLKDCTAYVYRKSISAVQPTSDTPYLNITIPGLIRTWSFNEDIKEWQLFFIVEEKFDVEDGTRYLDLPVKLNGKSYEGINTFRSGECLYISIPESVLPRDAKEATLTIAKGAKAVANAGWNGIRLNNEVNAYLFGGVWNNIQFTDYEDTDVAINHLNFTSYNPDAKRWDVYLNVNTELPGTGWFEMYEDVTVYLNGKAYTTYMQKAEYEGDRLLYMALAEDTFGKFHEGDIVYIPGDQMYTCGGYRLRNVHDYYLKYVNGMWFECYDNGVKAPEAVNSLWEFGRIDGYIPVQEEDGIMFTNVAPNNVIKSTEDMMDVTFSFETKKMLAMNEDIPTNSFVLRGQPIAEDMEVSETALYGYNISFSYIELTEVNTPDNPELWGTHSQEIAVWKNGINYNLLDQYRMTYNWQKTNHPFFKYDETYKYTVSIYNVEEDVCAIEVYCNDELIMSVVDRATDDPKDPARNAGEFQIYAACPQYFKATPVELDTLAASSSECYIGEQVRVSATYPAILAGAEYTVDGEGATMKDGVFTATKTGTYTVSGKFNGKDKGTVQIKVTEKPQENIEVEETSTFPIVPVAITGGSVLIVATIGLGLFLKKRKKNS